MNWDTMHVGMVNLIDWKIKFIEWVYLVLILKRGHVESIFLVVLYIECEYYVI